MKGPSLMSLQFFKYPEPMFSVIVVDGTYCASKNPAGEEITLPLKFQPLLGKKLMSIAPLKIPPLVGKRLKIIAPLKIPPILGEDINDYCTSKDSTFPGRRDKYLLYL